MRLCSPLLIVALVAGSLAFAEDTAPPHPQRKAKGAKSATAVTGQKLETRKRFVFDVLQSAIALPQTDPQDHLRVLVAAARVSSAVSAELSQALVRQGIELEAQIIGSGQKPAVSMLESGLVDCRAVAGFVDAVRPEAIAGAETSLASAVSRCPRQALEGVQRKLADSLRQGSAPPRLLLAAMEAAGPRSPWTAQQFAAAFASLPDTKESSPQQALQFADLYTHFADTVDAAAVRSAGVKMLDWVGQMDTSPERVEAVTSVVDAMKKALGQERYEEALRSDIMASQAAQIAGQPFEMSPPDEEATINVSQLFGQKEDKTAELDDMPASRRAREAAAYAFAAAHDGDSNAAERYFDTAFRALNDVWSDRHPGQDAVAIIEEVTQAAAHVDAIKTLARAQSLQDAPAQAISMLTVAQVVLSQQGVRPPQNQAAK